jgi:hypothetical protein
VLQDQPDWREMMARQELQVRRARPAVLDPQAYPGLQVWRALREQPESPAAQGQRVLEEWQEALVPRESLDWWVQQVYPAQRARLLQARLARLERQAQRVERALLVPRGLRAQRALRALLDRLGRQALEAQRERLALLDPPDSKARRETPERLAPRESLAQRASRERREAQALRVWRARLVQLLQSLAQQEAQELLGQLRPSLALRVLLEQRDRQEQPAQSRVPPASQVRPAPLVQLPRPLVLRELREPKETQGLLALSLAQRALLGQREREVLRVQSLVRQGLRVQRELEAQLRPLRVPPA